MSKRLIPLAAAAAMAAGASPAQAADWVYGGTTSGGEPIAVTAGKGAKKLNSIVVAWAADCDDGMRFPATAELTPALDQPGFTPGPEDLAMARNAKGRFKGTEMAGVDLGDATAAISLQVEGKFGRGRASGTLSAVVKIADKATGSAQASCQTGTLRWKASRSPGKIFAGQTSQEAPVVVRVDSRRRKVSDLMLTWHSQSCTPDGFARYAEDLTNFPIARSGAFADTFSQDYAMDGGGKRTFAYQIAARMTKTVVRGTIHVGVTETDGTGAQTSSCDTGGITWKARTG
jgi:hypothetical protein